VENQKHAVGSPINWWT